MKQILNKILAILVLLVVVFPADFSHGKNQNLEQSPALKSSSQSQEIQVISATPKNTVLALRSEQLEAANCSVSAPIKNGLLQGSFLANLNQLPGCLKIGETKALNLTSKIVFAQKPVFPVVKVSESKNFYQKESLNPFSRKTSDATEVFAVLFFAAVFYAFKKPLRLKLENKPKIIFYQPTVFELLVLRC